MPLIDFWKSNPETVEQLSISQIVATAGDGSLKDNSACSQELRDYLSDAPSQKIASYVEQCLTNKFERGGMILQDLVNELGRRLDYKVTNGRYQGSPNWIGHDGIWTASEGNSIIVEVKTTDAYRISLDSIANYRLRLMEQKSIDENSSILIIVGRQDTGELEAQVRGSRHAWSIRLISAESLIKLVMLKENSDEVETGLKIRSVLTPLEYTRLDKLVDVVFTTAIDVAPLNDQNLPQESAIKPGNSSNDENFEPELTKHKSSGVWEFTDQHLISYLRNKMILALSSKLKTAFIKRSRALYWDKNHLIRVACTVSKRHTRRPTHPYWYAHHPKWDEFLKFGDLGFLSLGCMDLPFFFAIPIVDFSKIVPKLNTTETEKGSYWHIHITKLPNDKFEIVIPKSDVNFNLSEFRVDFL